MINGLLHLSPATASEFYYAVAATCAFAGVAMVGWLLSLSVVPRFIEVRPGVLIHPGHRYRRRRYVIRPEDIVNVTRQDQQKVIYLKLFTHQGKFAINSAWLPSHGDIETITNWLAAHRPADAGTMPHSGQRSSVARRS